mmetsp:Transcript_23452/g.61229  ORF Transcript_23452/g.61229 Transcript_23452/m.61229 type:complete len:145 (-) Transcript_23452:93-527(-)
MQATHNRPSNVGWSRETVGAPPVMPSLMHEPHATLRPQTAPLLIVPSPQRRPSKPRRAPTPPLCDATPAEMMKILTLDGEWRTMGRSPLAAANELLDGDEPVDDCAVCGGSLLQPADDDEGPFAMSPPKLSPRPCRCPPARPGG